MIKKRDRAVFLGNRLKEYSERYHADKNRNLENGLNNGDVIETTQPRENNVTRSDSIQEELLTAA